MIDPLPDKWRTNGGSCPFPLRGTARRVFVELRNGMKPADSWPADPQRAPKTRWTLTDDPFDIVKWKLAE